MTDEIPVQELNKSLSEMRDKSRLLNDSLQSLAAEGFGDLAKAVTQAATSSRGPVRRETGSIVTEELAKLLRQEVASGIAGMFGSRHGGQQGVSVVIHNNTAATVGVNESGGGMDARALEITIDQIVANSLSRGRETGGVLRTLFGIVPSLLGR